MASTLTRQVTIIHQGHIGDIIAFIPIYRKIEGTRIFVTDASWGAPMTGYKYDSLKPLLDSQGIPSQLNFPPHSVIDYDTTNWRECYEDHITLMDSQARYLNVVDRHTGHMEIDGPWLSVEPDDRFNGKVIINRSHRYRNDKFPWSKIMERYGNEAVFIGTDEEHADFEQSFGKIQRHLAKDCLEIAKAIAACKLYVGNQSSAYWIAAGLRVPLIQEVYEHAPNSMILYPEAVYCVDGNIDFESLPK
jgi:hypothetical protein